MESFAKMLADLNVIWYLLFLVVVEAVLFVVFRRVQKLRPYTGQLLLLSAFLLLSLIFFLLTFSFKVSKMASGVSARSMPRLWVFLMLISAVLVIVNILQGKEEPDQPLGRWQLSVAVLVICVVSVALFQYIGYYVSSGLFIVAFMLLLGERRPVPLVATPVAWGVFTYFVFNKFLFITLPIGSLFEAIL